MRVQIVIFDGFDELDAIAPFEVLKTAAQLGADVHVELLTLDDAPQVIAAHGLRVCPEGRLDPDHPRPDVLLVPGGGWNSRASTGAWAEVQRGELPKAIASLHKAGTTVATVCTGGMLAQAAGLTRARPATTHHRALEELRASGTEVVDARVVDEGDLVTAGGVTSGLDLALWLVERYFGVDTARLVQSELEHERRGTVAGSKGRSAECS